MHFGIIEQISSFYSLATHKMASDKISKFQLFTPQNLWYDTYPIISSGEERPSFCKILLVSVVLGPRPSYAFITAVNACAAIP